MLSLTEDVNATTHTQVLEKIIRILARTVKEQVT